MPTLTTLKEIIFSIVASYKFEPESYTMANIGVAGLLPAVIAILFFTSVVYAFQIVFPPFDRASSLLSLTQDPSLIPPYDVEAELNVDDERRNRPASSEDERVNNVPGPDTVHFCFLVHGYQGLSGDLSYFETVLKHRACVERKHQSRRQRKRLSKDRNMTDDAVFDDRTICPSRIQEMVVHNCICNEGKTTDGVINGGDRLVDEIRKVIDSKMKNRFPEHEYESDNKEIASMGEGEDRNPECDGRNFRKNDQNESTSDEKKSSMKELDDITISIIGNSMGGLYGRYAIAKLMERHCVAENTPIKDGMEREQGDGQGAPAFWILDGKYRLRLDIFCTTASPHLGVSQHTWIRVPRLAEIAIASTMGETGRDLFRLNSLLYTMSTDAAFLGPLAAFRKRIAYANCYGTDFPVPVGTAAFLSYKSTYPHQFLDNCEVERECGLVIATLMTPKNTEKHNSTEEPLDELHQMSVSLDRLGWKKVFVDLQREMLSLTIPRLTCGGGSRRRNNPDFRSLKKNKTVTSNDISDVVNNSHENDTDDKRVILRVPTGHNMIVAFSRDRLSTFLNKGGRPLVNSLAKDLVQDIFSRDRNTTT